MARGAIRDGQKRRSPRRRTMLRQSAWAEIGFSVHDSEALKAALGPLVARAAGMAWSEREQQLNGERIKSAQLTGLARAWGLSYSTLHRLVHGTAKDSNRPTATWR